MTAPGPRVLGEVLSYSDLHAIMRARAVEMEISREQLDAIAGTPRGHASRILSPRPIKKLGNLSMGYFLPALAIRLVAVADEAKEAEIRARITTPRKAGNALHAGTVEFIFSKRHMRKIQKRGGQNSRKYMPKKRATEIARKANKSRWHKPKLIEVKGPQARAQAIKDALSGKKP